MKKEYIQPNVTVVVMTMPVMAAVSGQIDDTTTEKAYSLDLDFEEAGE